MPAVPNQVLAGDVYVITPGTGPYSINDSLVQNLSAQTWAEAVSPEIFSLGTLDGSPVVVRGVDPTAFLAVEAATASLPARLPPTWALAGSGIAARLGLYPLEDLTLVGSAVPRIDVVPLLAVFHAAGASSDEVVVDYATARFLTGVGPGIYHSIRVKTEDPAALLVFLRARGASAHVSGPSGSVGNANTGPVPQDPRIINLFLRYGLGPLPADYLAEGIAEATNSVQVVVWGVEILVALLVALGLHAVQARAVADRRATVGVLRALGAPGPWVGLRALREILPVAAVAAMLGSGLGSAAAVLLTPNAAIVALGHEVHVTFDPLSFLEVAAAVVAVSAVSQLVLVGLALRERPREAMRREPLRSTPPSLEVVLRE